MDYELIDKNRAGFREIFYKKIAQKDSKLISYKQFFKFCCTLKIYPDLISSFDLKRIVVIVMKKKVSDENSLEISFTQFEKLVLCLSEYCFPTEDPLKMMITHIKSMCLILYHVQLKNSPGIDEEANTSRPRARISANVKGASSNRKILNKSTSQKMTLSRVISPKSTTVLYAKKIEFKKPCLKIVSSRSKIEKINFLFEKFKDNHRKIVKRKESSVTKFLEKFVESIVQGGWMKKLCFELWKLKTNIKIARLN